MKGKSFEEKDKIVKCWKDCQKSLKKKHLKKIKSSKQEHWSDSIDQRNTKHDF
jgi:hypothetical protein